MNDRDHHTLTRYERGSELPDERRWEYADRGPDPYVEDEGGDPFPWRRYFTAILRYKWLVALALLIGGGGAYAAWELIDPSYATGGSLWIRSDQDGVQGPIAPEGLLRSYSWPQLLNSYAVLDSVVWEEQLYLQPERPEDLHLFDGFGLDVQFTPGRYVLRMEEGGSAAELVRGDSVIERARPGEPVGVSAGFRWTLPESGLPRDRPVPFSVVTPRTAAAGLQQAMSTSMDPDGNFLRVQLRGTDPERITEVLNATLDRLVDLAADLKSGNLEERRAALRDQLTEVEDELRAAERSLEEFRIQTITLPSEGSTPIQPGLELTTDPVFSGYFEMQTELESIRRQRGRLENVLEQATNGDLPVEMLELIPAAQQSSELQTAVGELRETRVELRGLLQRYTRQHPEVQEVERRVSNLETDVIPSLIRDLIAGLQSETRSLAGRVDSAGSELSEIPPRAIEEARLRRRVAMAEQLYQEVRSRYETTNLAVASTIPDIRVLDRPSVPQSPVNDQRIRYASMILLGSLGVGLLGGILLDRFDPRVRYPDEVERRFGLPFLGVIPRIPKGHGKASKKASREAYEAFRDLRTNLTFAYGSANPLIVAVSSPDQGDGKSLVSANLAIALADLGRKTLLIDGDTRRGYLHRTLGVSRKPGLTNLLANGGSNGGRKAYEKPTAHANLHLIPCGSRLSDSPELLNSGGMADAIADYKGRYDAIVVDTPPLGAGSDAALLSCMTGNLLLVLRSGSTNKEYTKAMLDPLRRLPVRVLGVVLNDYSARGLGTYAYYGTYLPGYGAGEERLDEGEGDGGGEPSGELQIPASSAPRSRTP